MGLTIKGVDGTMRGLLVCILASSLVVCGTRELPKPPGPKGVLWPPEITYFGSPFENQGPADTIAPTHILTNIAAANDSNYTSASFKPDSGSVILVWAVAARAGGTQVPLPSISSSGLTLQTGWTLVGSGVQTAYPIDNDTMLRVDLYYAVAADTTTGTVTTKYGPGNFMIHGGHSIVKVAGADTAGPFHHIDSGSGFGFTNYTSIISGFTDKWNSPFAGWFVQQSGVTFSPGVGYVKLGEDSVETETLVTQWHPSRDSTVELSWADTADSHVWVAVEIAAERPGAGFTWADYGGETGYEVERDTGQGWSIVDTLPADSLIYYEIRGDCNWSYRLRALVGGDRSQPSDAFIEPCPDPPSGSPPSAATFELVGIANRDAVTASADTAAFPGAMGWGATSTFGLGACQRDDPDSIAIHVVTDTIATADSSTTKLPGILVNALSDNKLDIVVGKKPGFNDMLNFGEVEVDDDCLIVAMQTAAGPVGFGGSDDFRFGLRALYLKGNQKHQIWQGISFFGSQSVELGGTNATLFQVGAQGHEVDHIIVARNNFFYCGDTCLQAQSGDGAGGAFVSPGWEDKHDLLYQRNLFSYQFKTTYADQGSKRQTYFRNVAGPGSRHRIPEYGEGDTIQIANNIINPNSNDKRPISARQPDSIPPLHTDVLGNVVLSGRGGPGGGVGVRPYQVGNSDSDTVSSLNMLLHFNGNVADTVRGTNGVAIPGDKPDPDASAWGDPASNTGCFVKDTDGFCADSTVFKMAAAASDPEITLALWAAWTAFAELVTNKAAGAHQAVDSLGRWVDILIPLADSALTQIANGTGPTEEDSATAYYGFPQGRWDALYFQEWRDDNGDGFPDALAAACNVTDPKARAPGMVWTEVEQWVYATDEYGVSTVIHGIVAEDSAQIQRFPEGTGPWTYEASLIMPDSIYDRTQFTRGDSIRVIMFTGTDPDTLPAKKVGCF